MPAPTTTNLKKEIFDLEKQYWDAMKANDGGTLKRLTGGKFTMVMDEGISDVGNDEFVKSITSGEMKLHSYKLDEGSANVRELAPGVALLTYKGRSEFERGGKPESTDNFFSSTWVKKGSTWQTVAGTAVRATPSR